MSSVLQDVRHALRAMAKSPAFTLVTVLTLGLGIGVNTILFSVVDAVLFRPLPVERPEQLVRIGTRFESGMTGGVAYPALQDFRGQVDALSGLAAYSGGNQVHLGIGDEPADRVSGSVVSGNYFSLLGVRPAVGRLLDVQDDLSQGGHPVLVLGHDYWKRRFGGDPDVVGTAVRMNAHVYTIVGVTPPGFHGIELQSVSEVWIPLQMVEQVSPNLAQFKPLERRGFTWLEGLGRLADGASPEQASAQLDAIRARVTEELKLDQKDWRVTVVPAAAASIPTGGAGDAREISWLLTGVAGAVWLIACAVAAGLLLVRAEQRQRDVALRFALGASRARVLRQSFTESILLAGASALVGLAVAAGSVRFLTAIPAERFPLPIAARSPVLESRVLWFVAGLTLLSAAAFGTLAAWRASRASLTEAIKRGSAGARVPGSRFSVRDALVVTQVALSAVLLVGAGLLLRTLGQAAGVDLGFETRDGLVVSLDTSKSGYTRERGQQFHDDLLERVRQLPGVRSAAITRHVPVGDSGMVTSLELSHAGDASGEAPMTSFAPVSPGYFATLGIAIERGRDFDAQDGRGQQVVIVNRAFADRHWPGRDPLGERVLNFGEGGAQVVGVVANAKLTSIRDEPATMLYVPANAYHVPNTNLLVRTAGDSRAVSAAILAVARQLDRNVPLYRIRSLEDQLEISLGKERMVAGLLTTLALLALALAALGLYAVISYTTATRTREFGVRLALGALPSDVLKLVLRQGAALAAVGLAIGLVAAAGASRVLESLLFGVSPTDGLTFASIAGVLLLVTLAACALPARRAARVDPIATLRWE